MKSPPCILSETLCRSLFGQWIFRNSHRQEGWERSHADCTKVLQTARSPRWSIEDCLVLKFVFTEHTKVCACKHGTSDFYFSMIIILEPQTSIITSVIMISFPLIMIFGNLPLILKKKKKRVCYSIVCYKRTIDCGMQFKDDICQQMPCIIWHCRNSNLFLFWK